MIVCCLAVALLNAAPVQPANDRDEALSLEDAQTLPIGILARRVLGLGGEAMIDVERPPDNPRAVLERLTFYTRSEWAGVAGAAVCRSDRVTVYFRDPGVVWRIETEPRYGLEAPQDRYRTPSEVGGLCHAARSTRHYFPAPQANDAAEVEAYFTALSMPNVQQTSQQTSFEVRCDFACDRARPALSQLKLEHIREIRAVQCLEAIENGDCYKINLRDGDMSINLGIEGRVMGLEPPEIHLVTFNATPILH